MKEPREKIAEEYLAVVPNELRNAIHALASKSRLGLLIYVLDNKEISFTQLLHDFKLNQSTMNHHLKELIKGGLIRNYFRKELGKKEYSFYVGTTFATKLLDKLFEAIEVPKIEETIPVEEHEEVLDWLRVTTPRKMEVKTVKIDEELTEVNISTEVNIPTLGQILQNVRYEHEELFTPVGTTSMERKNRVVWGNQLTSEAV